MYKLNKIGQEQFNWIFVLVAGGIILSFFILFAFKYVELKDKELNFEIGKTIDKNIRLLETSELYLETNLKIKPKVEFQCINDNSFFVVNDDYIQDLKEEIVFGDKFNTNKLKFWVVPWKYPFHVANFLFIGDERKYYLVYDQESRDYVESLDIPYIFDVKKISINEAYNLKGKVIYFNNDIIPDNYDEVNSYEDNGYIAFNGERIRYYGTEMVLAYIFSNEENFECSVKGALKRLQLMSKLYRYKANLLSKRCNYNSIINSLLQHERNYNVASLLSQQNYELFGKNCEVVF